ncbi:MAG: type II toxin-antitoxin system YoeB family toxin [Oscillospiraceae bacterium]|nr:type II toxin-antitoxin system YoeB family toxin [Oscillospiraceae bacterium]
MRDSVSFTLHGLDEKNRIIYRIKENNEIEILQCKGHYDDK